MSDLDDIKEDLKEAEELADKELIDDEFLNETIDLFLTMTKDEEKQSVRIEKIIGILENKKDLNRLLNTEKV